MIGNSYGVINLTKWAVVIRGPLTITGQNEIEATFTRKADAENYAREHYGKRWRRTVFIWQKQQQRGSVW